MPTTTEPQERISRRQLHDLANILSHLPQERWDDESERAAVLRGLATHVSVLRRIAAEYADLHAAAQRRQARFRSDQGELERLDIAEKETLRHGLEVAARLFKDHVRTFDEAEPGTYFTQAGLKGIRDQFQEYAHRTYTLLDRLDGADGVMFLFESEGV